MIAAQHDLKPGNASPSVMRHAIAKGDVLAMAARIAEIQNTTWPDPSSARDVMERMRRRVVVSAKNAELANLRGGLIKTFATFHRWKQSKSEFSIETLAAGKVRGKFEPLNLWPRAFCDHPVYFRRDDRRPGDFRRPDRRATALLGQPYADADEAFRAQAGAWASANGLAVSFPEFPSWWYPGRTILVLFVGAR